LKNILFTRDYPKCLSYQHAKFGRQNGSQTIASASMDFLIVLQKSSKYCNSSLIPQVCISKPAKGFGAALASPGNNSYFCFHFFLEE